MLENIFKIGVVVSALQLIGVGAVSAATVNIVRVADNAHESVYGLRTNTGTEGRDLDGATVVATYSDGSTETITWQAVDYNATLDANADGDDVDLFLSYDAVEVTTSSTALLTSLSLDLTGASSVFDSAYGAFPFPDPNSTPGSSFGGSFVFNQGGAALVGAVTATYSGIVNLANSAAAGDLFTTMTLDFTQLSTGGFNGFFSFYSDMDTLAVAGDLVPVAGPGPSAVPLPASMSFLLLGLAGLGLRRRAA